MAKVQLKDFELRALREDPKKDRNAYLDSMLRKFKKQVDKEEILDICKRNEFFLKKSIKRKEKSKRAKIKELKIKKAILKNSKKFAD